MAICTKICVRYYVLPNLNLKTVEVIAVKLEELDSTIIVAYFNGKNVNKEKGLWRRLQTNNKQIQ